MKKVTLKAAAPKKRNLVHLAMLQTKQGGAHMKSIKRERTNSKIAFKRSLKNEGGFAQHTHAVC